jgi:peptidoglycan hydrolase FlgJ
MVGVTIAGIGAAAPDPARIRKAANDFEAMVIGQFLQPMFDTVDTTKSAFGGGSAEAAWKPMLVQEIGKQIAAHGGFGLAEPVYAAMMRMQEDKKS